MKKAPTVGLMLTAFLVVLAGAVAWVVFTGT